MRNEIHISWDKAKGEMICRGADAFEFLELFVEWLASEQEGGRCGGRIGGQENYPIDDYNEPNFN